MQRRSILIVEDDPDLADLLQTVLGDQYQTEWAADVPSALTCLGRGSAEVVLLDCMVPAGSVTDVAEQARGRDCPVILMSGLPEMLNALAAFGYICLQKPFRMGELLDAIESACVQQQQRR
ncbi:MAG TPA: response regulator [Acetobacteraceae bacterium]|nr:response regulator [Acetobacteraceae bacterium]